MSNSVPNDRNLSLSKVTIKQTNIIAKSTVEYWVVALREAL